MRDEIEVMEEMVEMVEVVVGVMEGVLMTEEFVKVKEF